jgi:hypothetical protein
MNYNLNFAHRIPIKVFHPSDTVSVGIKINDQSVFSETFAPGHEHSRNVEFYYSYTDGDKNIIEFEFSGKVESSSRYLAINSLEVNNVYINLYDAHYIPNLNRIWWESLNHKAKDRYLDMIYGKNGNKFGWFGKIKYYYYCGVDFKSRVKTDADNTETLLGKSPNWVFLDQKANTSTSRKSSKYGKLL